MQITVSGLLPQQALARASGQDRFLSVENAFSTEAAAFFLTQNVVSVRDDETPRQPSPGFNAAVRVGARRPSGASDPRTFPAC